MDDDSPGWAGYTGYVAARFALDELDDATLFALFEKMTQALENRAQGRDAGFGVYRLDPVTLQSHRVELPPDEPIEAPEAPSDHGGVELSFSTSGA